MKTLRSLHGRGSRQGIAAVVVASLALLGACSSSDDSASGSDGSGTVKVGASPFAGFAAVYDMASDKNAEAKADVLPFSDSSQRGNALLNGNLDMALLGWTQVVELAAKGMPIVVLASNFEKGRTIIVGKKSGITSVADLRGKKVAYSVGSMVQLDLSYELKQAGMSIKDVNAVNMSFSDMVTALSNGDIDAYLGSEPQSSQTLTLGSGTLLKYPYDAPYGDVNGALVSTKSYVKAHPALVQQFLKEYVASTDSLRSDNSAMDAEITDMTKISDKPTLDLVRKNLQVSDSLDGYETKINALADALKQAGLIDKVPTYGDYVDASYLDKVAK